MRRAVRTLLTGRMIAVHLAAVALTITMVLLGRWQLDVSNAKHFYWQNFIYAIQWWIFSAFALFVWARVIRDALKTPPDDEGAGTSLVLVPQAGRAPRPGPAVLVDDDGDPAAPTLYRGYVMPSSTVDRDRSTDDRYRAAYNDQLWEQALADAAHGRGPRPAVARRTTDLQELTRRGRGAAELPASAGPTGPIGPTGPTGPIGPAASTGPTSTASGPATPGSASDDRAAARPAIANARAAHQDGDG